MATMNIDMVVVDSPMPPCAVGNERYEGTHRFSPHQANIVAAFMSVSVTTVFIGTAELRLKAEATPLVPFPMLTSRDRVHISGSSRFLRIHSVKIAGMMPTKNTARQP